MFIFRRKPTVSFKLTSTRLFVSSSVRMIAMTIVVIAMLAFINLKLHYS